MKEEEVERDEDTDVVTGEGEESVRGAGDTFLGFDDDGKDESGSRYLE